MTVALRVAVLCAMVGCASRRPVDAPPRPYVVCGRGPTVDGIDVSEHQGVVDWPTVRATGKRFAFARVLHAPKIDPTFARNWEGIRAAGMFRGAYVYFVPNEDVDAQADAVIAAVGRLAVGDLPVVLDVELPPPAIPAPAEYAARIARWVARVTAGTGRRPIVYTGRTYWNTYVTTAAFQTLPLWHAQYTSAVCPSLADAWHGWSFWQYACTGRIPGVQGDVDLDRFNGTLDELAHLAGAPDIDAGLSAPP